MNWLEKLLNRTNMVISQNKASIPDGVWTKCSECDQTLYREELERNLNVCMECGHHMYIPARKRLMEFLDIETQVELGTDLSPKDVLKFRDLKRYRERVGIAQKSTGERDAIVVMQGNLKGNPIVSVAFEFKFMAGSMGSVVGKAFVLAVEKAIELNSALVCFSTSGGARMQEGLFSLMQMAKTSAVLAKMKERKLPFISVLTNPTMGGVSASLAMLGDINIAEPKALIGFAGPRVIEQTVREKLPAGFQRSEFLIEKGAIDMIIKRNELRDKISSLLSKFMNN